METKFNWNAYEATLIVAAKMCDGYATRRDQMDIERLIMKSVNNRLCDMCTKEGWIEGTRQAYAALKEQLNDYKCI